MIRKTREIIIIINEKERYRIRMSSWLFKQLSKDKTFGKKTTIKTKTLKISNSK